MKRLISLSLSFAIIICSLFAFNSTAFANTKDKAKQITLGQTISACVSYTDEDDKTDYLFKFDCLTSNYYEMVTSLMQPSVGDMLLTVYEAETNRIVDFSLLASPQIEMVTTSYFEAGKSYYFKYEITASKQDFNAQLRVHNHTFTTTQHALAVADDDSDNSLDGYLKYICSACGEEYIAQVYTAPVYAEVSGEKFVYSSFPVTAQINVYDRNGNIVSPENYVVTYEDNLTPGKAYAYVNFVNADIKGELTTSFIILPAKQSLKTLTSKKSKQITVNWTSDKTVSGYELQYGTSSKFSKSKTKSVIISKKSAKSKTISKLKSKKKYYVRIRAYKTVDGVRQFGAWSNKLKVKTK